MNRIKSYMSFWKSISSFPLISESSVSLFLRCFTILFKNRVLNQSEFKWVNDSKLDIEKYDSGLRTSLYVGFGELEMLFLTKICNANEDFIDIGASSGDYSVLMAKVCNLNCYAFEPSTEAYQRLENNIRLNKISDAVSAKRVGVGSSNSIGFLTKNFSMVNHIVTDVEDGSTDTESIEIVKLDDLYKPSDKVFFLKIDVEGFEADVIKGGHEVFSHPNLLGIIMETNGSGCKYGTPDEKIEEMLKAYNISPYTLNYANNQFNITTGLNKNSNTLFTSKIDEIKGRLSRDIKVFNHQLNRYL